MSTHTTSHTGTSSLLEAAQELLGTMELAPDALEVRMAAIAAEVQATGTYTLTQEELLHGARLAWYNSNRCVARQPVLP